MKKILLAVMLTTVAASAQAFDREQCLANADSVAEVHQCLIQDSLPER